MKLPVLLLFLSVGFSGCSLFHKARPAVTAASGEPRLAGEVASVHREADFVLIDISGFSILSEGTLLQARREGQETARLRTSGEARRPFVVADILSGDPQTGDSAWLTNK